MIKMDAETVHNWQGVSVEVIVDSNGKYRAIELSTGRDATMFITSAQLKAAHKAGKHLRLQKTKSKNGHYWYQVSQFLTTNMKTINRSKIKDDNDISQILQQAMNYKPEKIQIDPIWWKFAVRTVIRGQTMMVVGPTGCGKSLLAFSLRDAFGLKDDETFFKVNLGASQDPRSTLIGNTHFDKNKGTFVSPSYFVQAIQVPNSIILLDEASRAHPEAHNILMSVLDKTQGYLRIDEMPGGQTIKVAPGVCFILTANIGSEYTATRTMDRALLDRCIMFEMSPMGMSQEIDNLNLLFPKLPSAVKSAIAEIAIETRDNLKSAAPQLDTMMSTRMVEETAGLIHDGFTLKEAVEVSLYPYFSDAGGQSPREFVKSLVQRHIDETSGGTFGQQAMTGIKQPWKTKK